MPGLDDVNDFTVEELEQLFNSDVQPEPSPESNPTDAQNVDVQEPSNEGDKTENNVENTKAFAKRLKESTDKVRAEEREAIAKSLGYESYADLQKKRDNEVIKDKGLDPETVAPVIEELVNKRFNEDPRMKELEELRKRQVEEFGKKELGEITKLTGGEITSLTQLPKEVLDLWKTKGSLKAAYMELEGEKLVNKIRSEQSKGSTGHLQNPAGSNHSGKSQRPLTEQEKSYWRFFNPNMTDEELNKIKVDN